jgi:hypothetical protein
MVLCLCAFIYRKALPFLPTKILQQVLRILRIYHEHHGFIRYQNLFFYIP